MTTLRIQSLELVGGGREVTFAEDFSIVTGSITTGKTTLVRLIRALLGRVPNHLPPETGRIRMLRGRVNLGSSLWQIERPLVTTQTAVVSLSLRTDQEDGTERIVDAIRLPAERPTNLSEETFMQWILSKLEIPSLAVPRARTNDASQSTPVTINDWLRYCVVRDDEIDTAVFGHRDPFVNRKRQAVFEINYEIFDHSVAALQAELRHVELQLDKLSVATEAVRRFLKDTPFQSLHGVDDQIESTNQAIEELTTQAVESAERVTQQSQTGRLRGEVQRLRDELASATETERTAARSAEELRDLSASLEAQSNRLTRAIVANEWLVDFDFQVCPRCGTGVDPKRAAEDHCYLCLQQPSGLSDADGLIEEQERVAAQIAETRQLVESRLAERRRAESDIRQVQEQLRSVSEDLDRRAREFVSSEAERSAEITERRAMLEARLVRLSEYRQLLARFGSDHQQRLELEEQRSDLLDALGQYERVDRRSEDLIRKLEARFLEYLQRLNVSLSELPLTASIHRDTYLPEISGRPFDDLSSQGLTVLVNVAHALAHHTVSIDEGLPLPGLLILDGLSNNVGSEGFDQERRDDTYRLLLNEVSKYQGKLQVIAFDNDVPAFAASHVAATLATDDRLIRSSSGG